MSRNNILKGIEIIQKIKNSNLSKEEALILVQEDSELTEILNKYYLQNEPCTTEININSITSQMVYVQGGTFMMGATSEQGCAAYSDEKPAHRVTLSGFYIGKYEVTQSLWRAVMYYNPSRFKGDNLPVEMVSWDDCQQFIKKLNAITGKSFRLPTEAEWEYAARGGKQSRHFQYSGSDNLDDVAWYGDNSNRKTYPVGTKRPNELGIYDMSGNVWEWCQDWYGSYSSDAKTDPKGPSNGSRRVIRGGCWGNSARSCRSSIRDYYAPDGCYDDLGLRLALSE